MDYLTNVLKHIDVTTGIDESLIISESKRPDVVGARYLAVHFLSRRGYYPHTIAAMLHKTPRCITFMLSQEADRFATRKLLRINCALIAKEIDE